MSYSRSSYDREYNEREYQYKGSNTGCCTTYHLPINGICTCVNVDKFNGKPYDVEDVLIPVKSMEWRRYAVGSGSRPMYYDDFSTWDLHSFDRPAFQTWHIDGSAEFKEWYIYGIPITDSFIGDWLKENDISLPFSDEDIFAIKLRWL